MIHVSLLVADQFTDSGLAIALDVLRAANLLTARRGRPLPFRVAVASAFGGPIRAASGLTIDTRAPGRADVVLAPGFWVEGDDALGTILERPDARQIIRRLASAHARGATVGASCSGVFFLAATGLLDGRSATTTWWLAPALQKRHPGVLVDAARSLIIHNHDRLLCAGAVFAMADLALHIVARFAGPALARMCTRVLLLDTHMSQAQYMALGQVSANDPTVRRAEAWARAHLADDFNVAALARHVGTSHRTLARRLSAAVGTSPLGFIQRIRVEVAAHLLETTRLSVDEIAGRVGYRDPNALRRLLRRETQSTPHEIRRRASPR